MTESREFRYVSYGLGAMGIRTAKALWAKHSLKCVGAIDIDPNLKGKDLGDIIGVGRTGILVSDNVDNILSETKPDIVVHLTSSHISQVEA